MARYRKIDTRIWNDERFRRFTDSGKLAFLFLLTHPSMTCLGAMRGTLSGLASELGWSPDAMQDAMVDAMSDGLVEVDEMASCMALKNWLRYNEPEGPNSIKKAWIEAVDMIPECAVKRRVIERSSRYLDGISDAMRKAVGRPFFAKWDGILDAMRDPSRIQEQEQEQDLDHDPSDHVRPSAAPKGDHKGREPHSRRKAQPELPLEPPRPASDSAERGKTIWRVFSHWKETMGQQEAFMDGSRAAVIRRALMWREKASGCDLSQAASDLCSAIDAAKEDPFCSGENKTGKPIVEIRTILGSAPILERLVRAAKGEGPQADSDDSIYPDLTFEGRE